MTHRARAFVLALALTPCFTALAGAADSAWRAKVDPWVLATAQRGTTEFLLVLAEQADLSTAREVGERVARVSAVVGRLTDVARRSQADLLADLRSRGIEHRSYWVANMVWVRGDLALVEALARRGDVARVSANPWVPLDLPETPLVGDPGSPSTVGSNVTQIHADDVWALGYTGQGIVVAGQDTGYQWDHPALKAHYRGWDGSAANHNYSWHDAIHSSTGTCGYNSAAPCDDYGHGTHTMGTMVGDDGGTNQIGVAPGAKWIGCRNMDNGNGTPTTYAECFQWFLAPTDLNGANPNPAKAPHVINNSWGCPPSEGCTDPNVLKTVVENVRAAGITVVVSAGNSGSSCSSVQDPPAIYDASFSVGSVGSTDIIASTSSRGPVVVDGSNRLKPEISAPGVSIRSSLNTGGYGTMSGTSMAGPHVAGATALLLSAMPSWTGNVTAVINRFEASALPRTTTTQTCGGIAGTAIPNNTYGYGRLDVLAAVSMSDLSVTISDAPDPLTLGGDLTYTITVSNAGPVAATGVSVSHVLPAGATFVSATAGCGNVAGTVTCTVGTLAKAANTVLTVVARPTAAGTASSTATVSGTLFDPDAANNQATASTEVVTTGADLSLVVVSAPNPALLGADLAWTVTVTNLGPGSASSLVVSDVLPAGVAFVSASGSCANSGGTVTCTIPTLAASASTVVTITGRPGVAGGISNSATVSAGSYDPQGANNTTTDQTSAVVMTPSSLAVDAAGNGVLEPGETVTLAPSWHNPSGGVATVSGTALLSGPAGGSYSLPGAAAGYGAVSAGATAACGAAPGCYSASVTAATRPALHWDATLAETLTPSGARTWTIHVGGSFSDVPTSYLLYRYVETLLHAGVTEGYPGGIYIPAGTVSRAQMAMFIARAMAGSDGAVPSSGSVPARGAYTCGAGGTSLFTDVAPTDSSCRHIHYAAAQGVTLGCTVSTFCPAKIVSRSQMAMFVARAVAGGDTGVPTAYTDPTSGRAYDCAIPTGLYFSDVTTGDGFCRHAHYLWARSMVDGCVVSPAQFCPAGAVSRGQMAKFLSNGFALTLY